MIIPDLKDLCQSADITVHLTALDSLKVYYCLIQHYLSLVSLYM